MVRIAAIRMKILVTFKRQIIDAGKARAAELYTALRRSGADKWATNALEWLKDYRFIVYIGVMEMNR
jgi:hypothetical protein